MKINDNMPKYLFTLISETGTIVCDNVPKEYDSLTIDLVRDIDYAGVFVEFKAGSLTFTGDAEKRLLRELWGERGLGANCELLIQYFDLAYRTYKSFSSNFVLDFNTYNEVLVSKSRNGIRINTEVTGKVRKLRDRKATKVDLTKRVSLGGLTMLEIDHWTAFRKTLNFPAIEVLGVAKWQTPFTTADELLFAASEDIDFAFPLTLTTTDFTEAQSIASAKGIPDPFFDTNLVARNPTIAISIEVRAWGGGFISPDPAVFTFKFGVFDETGTLVILSILGTVNAALFPTTQTYTYFTTFNFPIGYTMKIWGNVDSKSDSSKIQFMSSSIVVKGDAISIPATTVQSFPIYEALERNLQLMLDTQYPLKSDFFGRTDVSKNGTDNYLSENQERFAQIINGLSLRGMILDDINNPLAVSFDDLMKTANALWNVGFHYDSSLDRIVIEERAFFFVDEGGMDLSSRINDQEIQFEVLPDLAYAKIQTGYNSFDYEVINGRGEYNTKTERTSIITGSNSFDNVSVLRGDSRGITLALNTPVVPNGVGDPEGSKDLKSDKDNFIVKSQINAINTDEWDVELQENIQIENDSSYFGDSSMNLYFTPTRNLLRHNYELAAGLEHELSSLLRFQTSDKLQDLETTDGVDNIVENQDITVNDLGLPRWVPGQFIISLPFYEADILTLIENKHKLVKLSETKEGWILKAKYSISKRKVELNILQKYS